MRSRIPALGLLFLLAALGGACRPDRSLSRLEQGEALKVGYAIEAPYAFVAADGRVSGESPEVARRVARILGLGEPRWRQLDFDRLIDELEAGSIDMIAAGMFRTPEREKRVSFSVPTFRVMEALLVAPGNPLALDSYAAIARSAGARVAVLRGSVEEARLLFLGTTRERVLAVPDALTGKLAVETGMADAFAISSPTLRWLEAEGQLAASRIAEPFSQSGAPGETLGLGAFAFRREDHALRNAFNKALGTFVGSAEHLELVAPFGFGKDAMPTRQSWSGGR